jgi:hypothetical protein
VRRMIRLRLDRRLQGRVDASGVFQEAHLEVARRAGERGRPVSVLVSPRGGKAG